MGKRGTYNEEGELIEEHWESSEDMVYTTCQDSYCPGNCGMCS